LSDFPFWEQEAARLVDLYMFDRLKDYSVVPHAVKSCVCELAEYLYLNEGNENKSSEGIAGRSVTYRQGTPYRIIQRHLLTMGLLYRGSNYVATGHSEGDGDGIQLPPGDGGDPTDVQEDGTG